MEPSGLRDFWPDLSGLGSSDTTGLDGRATLLKVSAEMFVAAPSRDRDAVETFESLALGFLPTLDPRTLVDIARILIPCPDTPNSVRTYLLKQSPETRDVVIGHGRHEGASPALFGSWDGRIALAASSAITAATARQLLGLEEDAVDDTLAANSHFAECEAGFAILLDRARRRTALAHALLARDDLSERDEAALYLAASHERRAEIRKGVADTLAHRRAVLSFSLTQTDIDMLHRASLDADAKAIEIFLNRAFGFPHETDWRLLPIERHHLLALALKALGVATRDAMRMCTSLHPAFAHPLDRLKAFIRTMRETDGAVALALVEAILDVQALSARE